MTPQRNGSLQWPLSGNDCWYNVPPLTSGTTGPASGGAASLALALMPEATPSSRLHTTRKPAGLSFTATTLIPSPGRLESPVLLRARTIR
jgi:hypothetical protein